MKSLFGGETSSLSAAAVPCWNLDEAPAHPLPTLVRI